MRKRTYSAEAKLADDATTTAAFYTAILNLSRACIRVHVVQLKLRLVPNLGRQSLVACDCQVRATDDLGFVNGRAFANIAQNTDVDHCSWAVV